MIWWKLEGERNPRKLAALRDVRVQATEEEIARSLAGNWRQDVVLELKQLLATYDFLPQQMTDCDLQLQKEMQAQPTRPWQTEAGAAATLLATATDADPAKNKRRPKPQKARRISRPLICRQS